MTDKQRSDYYDQLVRIDRRDGKAVRIVDDFIAAAFKPRRIKTAREVAHAAKLRRAQRRTPRRPGAIVEQAIATLTPEERSELARKWNGRAQMQGET